MSGESEPRRSVRATKGQHKALDSLDHPIEPKKRGKKGKKAAQEEPEPEEEVIRCVCGATEQGDEEEGEPWIACENCQVWQHNVCMGLSIYDEDLDEHYWCEQCRPQNHKELIDAMAKGIKLWEIRRQKFEADKEKAAEESAKRKKGSKKGKGKRNSDPKEEAQQSPAPEPKKEPKPAAGKRKARDDSQDKDSKPSQKLRKVAENQASPATTPEAPGAAAAPPLPAYTPPVDIAAKISDISETTRRNAATGLNKSLVHSLRLVEKQGLFAPTDGVTASARAERLAIQIERAVHDTHPANAYPLQTRTLFHNLKTNPELALRLLKGTLTPPMLAAMTTDELASKELQRETADMKARAEKQSILVPEEEAPRVRRTHKGEELVSDDAADTIEEVPVQHVRRRSTMDQGKDFESAPSAPAETEGPTEPSVELPEHIEQRAAPPKALQIDTAQSPKANFDINKVFSSVKSPTASVKRRQSTAQAPSAGPGIDPEVDRMIQDDGIESPPYSPTEESDPHVLWRGNLLMNTIADLQVVAKHAGGAKLVDTINLPWTTLFPKRLTVAGRIDQQKAVEYLCSLRYSSPTDIVVTSLEPATEAAKPAFVKLIDYFVSKARYGVVGEKGIGNVRDTYLVPVLPGTGGHPEFMLNLGDNHIPETRTEKMLLCVFVYRNDPSTITQRQQSASLSDKAVSQSPVVNTPTPAQGAFAQRQQSISAPQFSPASPQAPPANYQAQRTSQTPVQPPQAAQTPANAQMLPGGTRTADAHRLAQAEGERVAREVLGPLISSPTVAFIMPHASNMLPKEWHLIREVYERDPLSREDLNRLSALLAEGSKSAAPAQPSQPAQPLQAVQPAQPLHPPQPSQLSHPSQVTYASQPVRGPQLQQPYPPPQSGAPQALQQPQQNPQQQQQQQFRAPPAQQTPIPPPVLPPQHKTTPVPPPAVPAGPPRQTPIPPPNIPHHAPAPAGPPAPTV